MKKIAFDDRFHFTQLVISGKKTQVRRRYPSGRCYFREGDVVAIAQKYTSLSPEQQKVVARYYPDRSSGGWASKNLVKAELMPWAIRITDVRAVRVQDITPDDAFAEGVTCGDGIFTLHQGHTLRMFSDPRKAFAYMLDEIAGFGTWADNRPVLAITFECIPNPKLIKK